jgi:SpoVK/Ycf46/Vps4 family AAA+-type ATPase
MMRGEGVCEGEGDVGGRGGEAAEMSERRSLFPPLCQYHLARARSIIMMDDDTRRYLLRTAIQVAGSVTAAVLSAVALRFFLLDRMLEAVNPQVPPDGDGGDGGAPGGASSSSPLAGLAGRLNRYEQALAGDLVAPEDVDASLADVGGLRDQVRDIVERVIFPLTHPSLFSHSKVLRLPTGILLHGPPGTGKTLLAKAIAKETSANFLSVSASSLLSKWYGESPKLVQALFSLATKLSPCIIFVDEIDGLLGARDQEGNGYSVAVKTHFLQSWEGLTTGSRQPSAASLSSSSSSSSSSPSHAHAAPAASWVLVIGATNRPWALDPAVLRRMPRQIHVGLPDASARADILRVLLRGERVEDGLLVAAAAATTTAGKGGGGGGGLSQVAALTRGFSGSDLRELVREAAMAPVRETLDALESEASSSRRWEGAALLHSTTNKTAPGELRPIRLRDLLAAARTVRPATAAAGGSGGGPRGDEEEAGVVVDAVD